MRTGQIRQIRQKYRELRQLIIDIEVKHYRLQSISNPEQFNREQTSFEELLTQLFQKNIEIGSLLGNKRYSKKQNRKRSKKSKRKRRRVTTKRR